MSKSKTLAIIIPNYNKGIYISRLLDSILKQTRIPDEIIIVDDCSTDDSKYIIDEYAHKNNFITCYYLKENHGVQFARNYGAARAKSEFISFIDSDDFYYDCHKIENEMKYAKKNRLVTSRFYFYSQSRDSFFAPDYTKKDYRFFKMFQTFCFVNAIKVNYYPYAYIISKDIFLKIKGYDFDYNLMEDFDILIKFKIKHIKFIYLKTYGRAYCIEDNKTIHLSEARKENIQKAKNLLLKKYSKYIFFSKIIYKIYSLVRVNRS